MSIKKEDLDYVKEMLKIAVQSMENANETLRDGYVWGKDLDKTTLDLIDSINEEFDILWSVVLSKKN